jgi:hypothetical protein
MREQRMWKPWRWLGNEHAIANARAGAVECSRRRLLHAEVELFLEARNPEPVPSSHPA